MRLEIFIAITIFFYYNYRMRKLYFIFLIFLACGQYQEPTINVPKESIFWQGYPHEDIYYSLPKKFSDTMTCLSTLGAYRNGEPYTILVKDVFPCQGYPGMSGCYSNGIIYVYEKSINPTTTIIGADMFKHEVIHWATGLGDDYHKSIYFTRCSAATVF